MGARFSAPVQTDPGGPPSLLYNGYRVFPGGKEQPGRDADLSPPSSAVVKKEYSYTSTPPTGRTACTEPQCLYKGALYFFYYFKLAKPTLRQVSEYLRHHHGQGWPGTRT